MGKLKEPTQNEQSEFSKFNIEDLLLGMVSYKVANAFRESSSETRKKFPAVGCLSRPTMTRSSIPAYPKLGSTPRTRWAVLGKVLAPRVSGKIKTAFAIGANSAS